MTPNLIIAMALVLIAASPLVNELAGWKWPVRGSFWFRLKVGFINLELNACSIVRLLLLIIGERMLYLNSGTGWGIVVNLVALVLFLLNGRWRSS